VLTLEFFAEINVKIKIAPSTPSFKALPRFRISGNIEVRRWDGDHAEKSIDWCKVDIMAR